MALKIAVMCVAAAVVCVAIRVNRPEIALATALAAGLIACALSISEIRTVIDDIKRMMNRANLENSDLSLILRASGLALIGEYASQLCRDAGEGALSQRVEFAVRVSLLVMVSPLAMEVMTEIVDLMG